MKPKVKKTIVYFKIVFFLLSFFMSPLWAEKAPATIPIKIGIIVPLSGDSAFIGEDIRNGFELAKEKSQSSKYDFQFIFEDNQFELRQTALAAQKLIHVDHVNVLISLWDGADVVAPLAEKNNILHISMRWDPGIAHQYSTTFTIECTYLDFARSSVELMKKLGQKRVAAISENSKGLELLSKEFSRIASENRIEIISDEHYNPDERDFRTLVAKSVAEKPDVVFLNAFSPAEEIILKQLKEIAPQIAVTGQFDTTNNMALIEGDYFASTIPVTPEFSKLFEDHYHHPFKIRAPHAFDIFNLLSTIYEKFSSTPTTQEVISELMKIKDYPGALGKLTVEPERNIRFLPVWHHVVNGKVEIFQ